MDHYEYLPPLSGQNIRIITESIAAAVGDEITEDVQSKHLITQNGTPGRTWDFINAKIFKRFQGTSIIARPTQRGAWAILLIFNRENGVLYCCMKENNFRRLRKMEPKKRSKHYAAVISHVFNSDLPILNQQTSLFSEENVFDEDTVRKTISGIIKSLGVPTEFVKRHALILFRSGLGYLFSIRCCSINSDFEIVGEHDWSQFIPVQYSAIVEKESQSKSVASMPDRGLSFTNKAKKRSGHKHNLELSEEEQENSNPDD